jgi:hypothetical protein
MFKTSSNESHAWLIFAPEDGAKNKSPKKMGGDYQFANQHPSNVFCLKNNSLLVKFSLLIGPTPNGN